MEANAATAVSLGWLWFDNDAKLSLEDKVDRAAQRFRQKFGRGPQLCYVNPGALDHSPTRCGQLVVHGASNILPGHFLFVVEQ